MMGIKLFQCIPVYKPIGSARLIKSLFELGCKILLDIEDSIQDVQNTALNETLKKNARDDFEKIINIFPDKKFSLRINSVRGNEFKKDKYLIERFSDNIETVFIPKVESSKDIEVFYSVTSSRHKLNLIIETQKGVDNINNVLDSSFADNIDFVFFGNYDFHLDTNTYPITEQHSLSYWKIVEPIITKVENHKIKFGNSPYADIADKATLDFILMQLTKICKANFALMSLHKSQTIYFKNLISEWKFSGAKRKKYQKNDFTLETFDKYKQKGRSFSFVNNRVITPQEYLLALKKQYE